jgi:putative methyltransferase (TIGR04325 family)
MREFIKQFIPPILLRKKQQPQPPPADYHEVFTTYHDALKGCTTDAYEEDELIRVIAEKTKRFAKTLETDPVFIWETSAYSLISLISPAVENKTINVLDFGGACGAHYFHARKILPKEVKLNWVVVETPTMVRYAQELRTNELSFYDSLAEGVFALGTIDLLHTSGTLQCVNDPFKYLDDLLNCNAKTILFNRLGLNRFNTDIITIHSSMLSWNGIGDLPEGFTDRWVKYPFIFPPEKRFMDKLTEKYSVAAKFDDKSGIYPVHGAEIVGYGLLCKRI